MDTDNYIDRDNCVDIIGLGTSTGVGMGIDDFDYIDYRCTVV